MIKFDTTLSLLAERLRPVIILRFPRVFHEREREREREERDTHTDTEAETQRQRQTQTHLPLGPRRLAET